MTEKKTQSMQFSMNIKALVRLCLCDPDLAVQIQEALAEGPAAKTTDQLGYWNMGGKEKKDQIWCTMFAATDRTKQIGEQGLIYRAEKSQQPLFRFKEQNKDMTATKATPAEVVKTPAPLQVAGPAVPPSIADIAASLGMTEKQLVEEAAKAMSNYKPEVAEFSDETTLTDATPAVDDQLPADLAALVGA